MIFIVEKPESGDNVAKGEVDQDYVVMGTECPEPKRTGEATVARCPVFVVENDFTSCLPADAPARTRGRHVRWIDQQTYLPLKMEMHAQDGAVVDRYEVTSIAYDVDISAKTFSDPACGHQRP
jgi:outer membrane lipoprotein-sorting protein